MPRLLQGLYWPTPIKSNTSEVGQDSLGPMRKSHKTSLYRSCDHIKTPHPSSPLSPALHTQSPKMSLTMSNVNACRAPVLCARGASTRANAAAGRALSAPRGLRVSLPSRTSRNVAIAALPQKEGNITREDEPEEYWASKAEQGGNPMKVTRGLSLFRPICYRRLAPRHFTKTSQTVSG